MADSVFPFPALVADIGGTNVRFAVQADPKGSLSEAVHLKTWDYPNLAEAIEAAIPKLPVKPRSVIACGAGPVEGRELKLTNAPWRINGPDVAKRLGLGQGLLLNDFEAQALSLPIIDEEGARLDRSAEVRRARTRRSFSGPGTGLGVAALNEIDGRHTPFASEFCHISYGPESDEEWAIWPHLERAHGRITMRERHLRARA